MDAEDADVTCDVVIEGVNVGDVGIGEVKIVMSSVPVLRLQE